MGFKVLKLSSGRRWLAPKLFLPNVSAVY